MVVLERVCILKKKKNIYMRKGPWSRTNSNDSTENFVTVAFDDFRSSADNSVFQVSGDVKTSTFEVESAPNWSMASIILLRLAAEYVVSSAGILSRHKT